MRLKIKKVTLKADTENDYVNGVSEKELAKYINYIKTNIANANYLINNKIDDMDDYTLYDALKKLFKISFDKDDYLRILSRMQKKHYTNYLTIKTSMLNKEDNISYFGVATSQFSYYDGSIVDLKTIRRITNNNDFLVLKTIYEKDSFKVERHERLENHQYLVVDVDNPIIDEDSELFPYAIDYLKKTIRVKDVLYELKWFVKEVIHQARCITDLVNEKDEKLQAIGRKYSLALNRAFNTREIPEREKISVRKHKKIKVKKSG